MQDDLEIYKQNDVGCGTAACIAGAMVLHMAQGDDSDIDIALDADTAVREWVIPEYQIRVRNPQIREALDIMSTEAYIYGFSKLREVTKHSAQELLENLHETFDELPEGIDEEAQWELLYSILRTMKKQYITARREKHN